MKLIWFLFIFQTLVLCISAFFADNLSIEILGVDLFSVIHHFRVRRFHQPIHILFLVSIWFVYRKKVKNMLHYFVTRKSIETYLLLSFYVVLLILYVEIWPSDYLYTYCIYPFVAFFIVVFPYAFPKDPVKNPVIFKEDPYNFVLLGKEGQTLPITYPQQGIFTMGAPGSGKTKCVIEPILAQMIYKGYSGILYDYDFSPVPSKNYSLTHLAYRCMQEFGSLQQVKSRFVLINFQDLSVSSRMNPINPDYVQDRKKLSNCIQKFLLNLNPQIAQKDDFWHKNTYALLKSVIVFLANKYPTCCTLPHAILFGLQPHNSLMTALLTDAEASLYASPVIDAYKLAPEQFAGVMASFKVSLERLLDKNLFWVLSGDEVPLLVNDATNPLIVCLGNTPTEQSLVSPVLSMIMAALVPNMFAHGRTKSFVAVDELSTIIYPNLSEIPALARKYGISTIVALQNMAQLEKAYTEVGAREIQESFGNHFIGRGSLHSAQYLSDLIGKQDEEAVSTTETTKQISKTTQKKEQLVITPQDAMMLHPGEFLGKVVHPSGGFFKMQLLPIEAYDKRFNYKRFQRLPILHHEIDVDANFKKIQSEVMEIVRP